MGESGTWAESMRGQTTFGAAAGQRQFRALLSSAKHSQDTAKVVDGSERFRGWREAVRGVDAAAHIPIDWPRELPDNMRPEAAKRPLPGRSLLPTLLSVHGAGGCLFLLGQAVDLVYVHAAALRIDDAVNS